MRGKEFLSRLHDEVLVGDGAFGTMLSERGLVGESSYERLNLTHSEIIKDLHGAYLAAGAQVLETNTFGGNRTKLNGTTDEIQAINRAGAALAREVAGDRAYVAGSIGPLAVRAGQHDVEPLSDDEIRGIFQEQ